MADKIDPVVVPIEPKVSQGALAKVKASIMAPVQAAWSAPGQTIGHAIGAGLKHTLGGGTSHIAKAAMALKGGVVGAVGAATGGLGDAASGAVLGSVGKFNPAVVERFNDALDDIQATLGRFLLPMVEHWTEQMRLAGDVLASILPNQAEMRALAAEYKPLLNEIRSIMSALAPLIKDVLVTSMQLFAKAIHLVVHAITESIEWLRKNVPGASKVLGEKGKSSLSQRAFAAHNFSYTGVQDPGRSAVLGALNRGQGESPEEKTADFAEKIYNWISGSNGDASQPINDKYNTPAIRFGTLGPRPDQSLS